MKVNDTCALTTNEPEEGEIVDDCEDATRAEEQFELISSDEEAGMRERIRELEEKNAEIECITAISRSYGNVSRALQVIIT